MTNLFDLLNNIANENRTYGDILENKKNVKSILSSNEQEIYDGYMSNDKNRLLCENSSPNEQIQQNAPNNINKQQYTEDICGITCIDGGVITNIM